MAAVSLSLAGGLAGAQEAAVPAQAKTVNKQCQEAQGDVRRECEAVAAEMAKPKPPERVTDDKKMVTHSSPVMDTKEQKQEERSSAAHSHSAKSATSADSGTAPAKAPPTDSRTQPRDADAARQPPHRDE